MGNNLKNLVLLHLFNVLYFVNNLHNTFSGYVTNINVKQLNMYYVPGQIKKLDGVLVLRRCQLQILVIT